jgi:hypothetical protein
VEAEGLVVAPVLEADLGGGLRLPFRPYVLRAGGQTPLPSTAPGVRRAALREPRLEMLPLPRSRAEYDAAAATEPSTLRAPAGVLEDGPGERRLLHLSGGVRARSIRGGVAWDFEADEATSDAAARTLRAGGAVSVASESLRLAGKGLEAAESTGHLRIGSDVSGSVDGKRGVRLAGAAADGPTRFRCRGPARVVPLEAAARATESRRWRITLEEEAVVEQEGTRLAARRIELDVSRSGPGGATEVDEVRADGAVVLEGRREDRTLRATADRLVARPRPGGTTEAWLDGSPTLRAATVAGGAETEVLEVRGGGGARLAFPDDEGPASAEFRGGSTATWTVPAEEPGGPPRVRELTAATVTLAGMRALGGDTRLEHAVAVGSALLREGDRTARGNRLEVRPLPGGGTRAVLDGDVLVSWPGVGRLDALDAGTGPGAPPGDPGVLLLASPGRAALDFPPDGAADRGGRFEVSGGAVLRRVVGEREIYRLSAAALDGRGAPDGRALEHLRATGDVALAGREEGPGGRRYEMRGEVLEVRGAAGADGPRTADLDGPAGGPAEVRFVGEDGRPFSIAARALRLDHATGALHAEGAVRGKGILPGGDPARGGAPRFGGGPTEIACGVLDAFLGGGAVAGQEGATRVRSLDARDSVWIRTETAYASGDRLTFGEDAGSGVLRGAPARVTARTAAAAAPAGDRLEDLCEAPEFRLSFEDGKITEALAPGGGRVVGHRVVAGSPPERIDASCRGPLAYRPAETRLRGDVEIAHAVRRGGTWLNLERTAGADEVVLHHPPSAAGVAGGVIRAVAAAEGGRMTVDLGAGEGARVEGVSRADFDGAAGRVALESSPGHPRFRVRSAGTTTSCRRAVYEIRTGVLVEMVGATVEGGR